MRLIDADAYEFPGDLINEPTVDAVPVVRCEECRCSRELTCREKKIYVDECMVCTNPEVAEYGEKIIYRRDFCSYGERRADT